MKRLLFWSAMLTFLGLALQLWSMFQPTPLPVMLAMSVGQGIGTLAFGLYGFAILIDMRRTRRRRRESLQNMPKHEQLLGLVLGDNEK
jgi:hypothetical protein